jgi:2-(1,2-epoxy-1,2-dihydrophenyl)acetyl-CoA isomerase
MGSYTHLLVETTPEGVRTLTLNRPDRLNAFNDILAEEVPVALAEASRDDEVRVVVITGAGRGFCAGLDLSPENIGLDAGEVGRRGRARERSRHDRLDDLGWVGRQALALVNCDKPVIAAINGPAAGAGLSLALGADIRLMSDAAFVTTGYVRRGLSPDGGQSYFLPRLVGLSRATELILTARDVKADEAERIGLVSLVFPAEGFREAVASYATKLAAGPPIAQTLAKRLLVSSLEHDLPTQLRMELTAIGKCFGTEDTREAMRAFNERRTPQFTGRY